MRNSSPVATGQKIANKYVVERVLGEGGMGVVIAAWHLGLDQRVAIKLLLRERLQHDESAIERFQREARAAARIRSQHVCRVLDTGALDDGTPFLVMEYLEGLDLADELVHRGRIPAAEAVGIVREACEALVEAHAAGVVHRDLKPANLFMVQRPDGSRFLKVLDFGVSKSLSSSGTPHRTLTKTASLVGSPIYMSPEQLNSSRDVDGRTDIWALGVILYELVSGRTPFFGESIPQLVNAVLHTEPESLAALGVVLPAGLEAVIQRALCKSRDERFSSARELAQALLPFGPNAQVSISRTVAVSENPPPPHAGQRPELALEGRRVSASSIANRISRTSQPAAEPSAWSQRTWALLVLSLIVAAGLSALLSRKLGQSTARHEQVSPADAVAHDAGSHAIERAYAKDVPVLPEVSRAANPLPTSRVTSETSRLQPVPAQGSEPAAPPEPQLLSPRTQSAPPPLGNEPALAPRAREKKASREAAQAPKPRASEPAAYVPQENGSKTSVSNFGGRR